MRPRKEREWGIGGRNVPEAPAVAGRRPVKDGDIRQPARYSASNGDSSTGQWSRLGRISNVPARRPAPHERKDCVSDDPPRSIKGFATSAAADAHAPGRSLSWRSLVVAALVSAGLASAVTYVVVTRLLDRADQAPPPVAQPPGADAPGIGGRPMVIENLPAVLTHPVVEAAWTGYPMQLWPTIEAGSDVLCEAIAQGGERPEWKKSEYLPDLWECFSFGDDEAEGYKLFAMVRGADEASAGEIRLKLTIDGMDSTVSQELALADLAHRVGLALGPLLADALDRTVGGTEGGTERAYNTEFTVIRDLSGGRGRDVVVTLPERFATRFATGSWHPRGPSPPAR